MELTSSEDRVEEEEEEDIYADSGHQSGTEKSSSSRHSPIYQRSFPPSQKQARSALRGDISLFDDSTRPSSTTDISLTPGDNSSTHHQKSLTKHLRLRDSILTSA